MSRGRVRKLTGRARTTIGRRAPSIHATRPLPAPPRIPPYTTPKYARLILPKRSADALPESRGGLVTPGLLLAAQLRGLRSAGYAHRDAVLSSPASRRRRRGSGLQQRARQGVFWSRADHPTGLRRGGGLALLRRQHAARDHGVVVRGDGEPTRSGRGVGAERVA